MKGHASMNRVFRLVWNEESHTWVAVSEIAGGRGGSGSALRKSRRALHSLCGLILGAAALSAYGVQPNGAQVVSGAVSIDQSLPNQTQITQSTAKAIVNWNGFSIGSDHQVTFSMPNSSSISLNRVVGDQASRIDGKLISNGQVWLLNPNGVLIGQGGTVNAQGFLASTRSLADQDFLDGNYRFNAEQGGLEAVQNSGHIVAGQGGYAVLSGQVVNNDGVVQANLGHVVMAGAESFTVDVVGDKLLSFAVQPGSQVETLANSALVENSGELRADGGRVLMSAQAASEVVQGVVNVGGLVQANSVRVENGSIILGAVDVHGGAQSTVNVTGQVDVKGEGQGGRGGVINVAGQHLEVAQGAVLNASGDAGGGSVNVGAGWKGKPVGGQAVAETVNVKHNAQLKADATARGNGGEVVVFSDLRKANGVTTVQGSLSARGKGEQGDGGRIETSGHTIDINNAKVNAGSEQGKRGQWLIDPADIVIDETMASSIEAGLETSDVLVETNTFEEEGLGDITVASNITYTGVQARTLTLKAERDVVFNPGVEIRSVSAPLNTILWSDADGFGDGRIYMPVNSGIYSGGGRILLGGGFGGFGGSGGFEGFDGVNEFEPVGEAAGRFDFANNSQQHGIGLFGATLSSQGGDITLRGVSANLQSQSELPASDDAGTLIAASSRVSGVVIGTHQGEFGNTGSLIDSGTGALEIYGRGISSEGLEGAAVHIHPLSTIRMVMGSTHEESWLFSTIHGDAGGALSFAPGASRVGVFNQGSIETGGRYLQVFGVGGDAFSSAGVKQWGDLIVGSGSASIHGHAGFSLQSFNPVEAADVSFLHGVTGSRFPTEQFGGGGISVFADTVHVAANIQNLNYVEFFTSDPNVVLEVGGNDVSLAGQEGFGVLGLDLDELNRIQSDYLYLGTSGIEFVEPGFFPEVGIRINTNLNLTGVRSIYAFTPRVLEVNADVNVLDSLTLGGGNIALSGTQRQLTSQNGHIHLLGPVNSSTSNMGFEGGGRTALNVDSGNGMAVFDGAIGELNPLSQLNVNAQSGIYLYGDVFANQAVDLDDQFGFYIPSGVSTNSASDQRKTSNLILSLTEGSNIEVGTAVVPGSSNSGTVNITGSNPNATNNLGGLGAFEITNSDTYLTVYKDGVKVAENDNAGAGLGSYLNFAVPEGGSGTYVFSLGCAVAGSECGGNVAYRSVGGGDSSSIQLNGLTYLDGNRVLRANTVSVNGSVQSFSDLPTSLQFDASHASINGYVQGGQPLSLTAQGSLSINNATGVQTLLDVVKVNGRLALATSNLDSASGLSIAELSVLGESDFDLNAQGGTYLENTLANLGGVVSVQSNQSVSLKNNNDLFLGASSVVGHVALESVGNVTFNDVVSSQAGDIKVIAGGNINSRVAQGVSPLQVSSLNRYLVYSQSPGLNNETGLSPSFLQYGLNSVNDVVQGSGSGLLYFDDFLVSVRAGQTFSKVYDGLATLPFGALSNIVVDGSEGEAIAQLSANPSVVFSSKNAGTTIQVGPDQLGILELNDQGRLVYGAQLDLTGSSSISGNITQRALAVNYTGVNKVYDGTTQATVNTTDDRVSGDQIIINRNASFIDKNAGTNKAINVGGIALAGVDAQNYTTATNSSASADIARKQLQIALVGSVSKTDDGTNVAALTPQNYQIAGVVSGDAVAVNQPVGRYATTTPGTGIVVSAALTNSNLNNANYAVANNAVQVSAPIGTINAAVSKSIALELSASLKSTTPTAATQTQTAAQPASQPTQSSGGSSGSSAAQGGGGTQTTDTASGTDDDGDNTTNESTSTNVANTSGGGDSASQSTSATNSAPASQTSAPADSGSSSTPAPTQTAAVQPPGGSNNSPVVDAPPSPVGDSKPATPTDVADSSDSTLSAVQNDGPPPPASSLKRSFSGVTLVDVGGGISMQQLVPPATPPSASKDSRTSLTGGF